MGETLQCYISKSLCVNMLYFIFLKFFCSGRFLLFIFWSIVVYKSNCGIYMRTFNSERKKDGNNLLKAQRARLSLGLCNLQNVIESACTAGCGDALLVSHTDRFGLWCSWSWPGGGEPTIYILPCRYSFNPSVVLLRSHKSNLGIFHTWQCLLSYLIKRLVVCLDKRPDFTLCQSSPKFTLFFFQM